MTTTTPTREWTVPLPWPRPPLSMNDRRHWRAKAREVAAVRETAALLFRSARIPALATCTIELHYEPRDRRVRDVENPVASLKPIADALVDAGVVPDDRPELMAKTMPILHPPAGGRTGRTWVIVREGLS